VFSPIREYFIKDGAKLHTWEYDETWGRKRKTVYEVMRVIKGVPLFGDEHIGRLIQSGKQAGLGHMAKPENMRKSMLKLIESNSSDDGNILLCLIPNDGNIHILSYYIAHHYPSEEDYSSGVSIQCMKAVRSRPNAKIWNSELRSKAEHLISSSNAYEVLLVNKKKNITEGSRSNIFFIRGNAVFTTLAGDVLEGITRQKVIEICNESDIQVKEKEIPLAEIPFYEAAFITGTSPGILPVSLIDQHRFNTSNEIMRKLMATYNSIIRESVSSK